MEKSEEYIHRVRNIYEQLKPKCGFFLTMKEAERITNAIHDGLADTDGNVYFFINYIHAPSDYMLSLTLLDEEYGGKDHKYGTKDTMLYLHNKKVCQSGCQRSHRIRTKSGNYENNKLMLEAKVYDEKKPNLIIIRTDEWDNKKFIGTKTTVQFLVYTYSEEAVNDKLAEQNTRIQQLLDELKANDYDTKKTFGLIRDEDDKEPNNDNGGN